MENLENFKESQILSAQKEKENVKWGKVNWGFTGRGQ